LRRELTALAVGDQLTLGDAKKRIVRLVIVAGGEKRLVGGHQRQTMHIGKIDERRLGEALAGHAMALQFDVETIAEQALQNPTARLCYRMLSSCDRAIEWTVRSTRKRNQSIGAAVEPG